MSAGYWREIDALYLMTIYIGRRKTTVDLIQTLVISVLRHICRSKMVMQCHAIRACNYRYVMDNKNMYYFIQEYL